MMTDDDGDDLLRCLGAFQRVQGAWLQDAQRTLETRDQAFAVVFRRWQRQLSAVQLHLHRCEDRLLHRILAPGIERQEVPAPPMPDPYPARRWQRRFDAWFEHIHLDGAYRRLDHVRDLEAEAVTADILTDLSTLAELVETTAPVLARIAITRELVTIEDLAFYGVIAPWRVRGMTAVLDVSRWLVDTLVDEDDW